MQGLKRFKMAPAFIAVMVQLAAFFAVFVLAATLSLVARLAFHFEAAFPLPVLVLMQSTIAAALSYRAGMQKWWYWIQFFFPLAVWVVLDWQVPPQAYLVAFLVSLSLFWTTFNSQVPFYPSHRPVWEAVLGVLPQSATPALRLVEIGSGLGSMAIYIAHKRPDVVLRGIEIAPLPWLISKLRAMLRRSPVVFSLGDYHRLNFADYDLVFAYLSPAAMPGLWQKCSQEMRPGSLLVSYEFEVPGVKQSSVISLGDKVPPVYVWRMHE